MINVRATLTRIGRRGAVLCFLAEVDLLLYVSLRLPLPYGLSPAQVYAPVLRLAPLDAWAAGWLTTGIACAIAVLWLPLRPYAYMFAAGIKTAWGLAYLWAWISGALPRGYMQAAFWLTLAGLILIISGWREGGAR